MGDIAVVLLAAGQGTRMRSDLPKVLHKVAGRSLVAHVLEAAAAVDPIALLIVVGYGAAQVREALGPALRYVEQTQQLGTGHAVLQASRLVGAAEQVLVLYGDTPLLRGETLKRLVQSHAASGAVLTMLTGVTEEPSGYGRVVRGREGELIAVVEDADADETIRGIKEVNSGVCCFEARWMWSRLAEVKPSHKGEYYLTDLVGVAVSEGARVGTLTVPEFAEVAGINNRAQLAAAEIALRWRVRSRLMDSGVSLLDPATTYVDSEVEIGRDTVLYPQTLIEGSTRIGCGCVIGPNCRLTNAQVGDGCRIESSVVEDSCLADGVRVGPFAHLRHGSAVGNGAQIGSFAEIKNSILGSGTKMHHFSYVGDAQVGERVNIAAGSITCNYDAESDTKSQTVLEDDVALGSGTLLVAPVRLHARSVTGAGAVVTRDVPADSVAVGVPARVVRHTRAKK